MGSMRTHVFIFSLILVMLGAESKAQRSIRIGYVDMNYILENVPEYQEAQTQLDKRVAEWKSEIEKRNNEVEQMKQALENERVLLTQELIKEREDEIRFMQNEILEYQQKRFGPEGDLIEPIQDQVFNAVQEIGNARQYDFVLDKSSDLVMLYADKRHDVSDQVLLSIKRSSKRTQVQSRSDKEDLERSESLSVEEVRERESREAAAEAKQTEREQLIEARRATRDSIQNAKKEEFERRRREILEERQRRKDSIEAARSGGNTSSNPSGLPGENPPGTLTPEQRRQQILEERQRRRDSILESR